MKSKTKPFFKKKELSEEQLEEIFHQEFFDMIAPSTIRFYTDYFICGNTYRSVWALREYPTTTEEQAILRTLGERDGVTLRIYCRPVTHLEQRKIIANATRKNRLSLGSTNDVQESVKAKTNLDEVTELITQLRKNKEPLLHTAVYVELIADSLDELKELQAEIQMELTRSKINIDKLLLRQKEGFQCATPIGNNVFGIQFERVLPASSVANFYPFNYSGKTDANGFYIGKDKFGTNVIVDFDQREVDKTNGNILILGNSGQGKSYLLKLIVTNLRESGKGLALLDPEHEYRELTESLGGCFIDLMTGEYIINLLEPKAWTDIDSISEDMRDPEAFHKTSVVAQHIAFLKDFFRSYKDFEDRHIDTLELMLMKLYDQFNVTDAAIPSLPKDQFPILSDLYEIIEQTYADYDKKGKSLYTEQTMQELCLSLHSMCKGTESRYFNGHTNITDDSLVTFGVKGLLEANSNLKNAMLFNLLSYMSNLLLTKGNTVASIDELYLFLSNLTAVEYIRNLMKRVRKKNSSVIVASQNLNDYFLPEIQEYTKPLFAIPTHQFLFHPGTIDEQFYKSALQLEDSEYNLIRYPERGNCLFKCGNERYNLQVKAPAYKAALFGDAGGN